VVLDFAYCSYTLPSTLSMTTARAQLLSCGFPEGDVDATLDRFGGDFSFAMEVGG